MKTKFISKSISLFAILALISAAIIPQFNLNAAAGEDLSTLAVPGSGTQSKPIIISTPQQLADYRDLVNQGNNALATKVFGEDAVMGGKEDADVYTKLGADIDLGGKNGPYGENYVYDDATGSTTSGSLTQKGWRPIGTGSRKFTGQFDGAGYTISNLYIKRTVGFSGLFGFSDTGSVLQNVGLVESIIVGLGQTGGIVGQAEGSILNVYNKGFVKGTSAVGGIAGESWYELKNAHFDGTVTSTQGLMVGGIAGYGYGIISNTYNIGAVFSANASNSAGGIVGWASYSSFILNNSVSLGSIIKTVNNNNGRIIHNGNYVLSNNYAWEGITKGSANCDWDGSPFSGNDSENDFNGQTILSSDFGTTILSSAWWQNSTGAGDGPGWDTDNWKFSANELPILKTTDGDIINGQDGALPTHLEFPLQSGASAISAFQIATAEQLACLANLVNDNITPAAYNSNATYYKLTSDLDLGGYDGSFGEAHTYTNRGSDNTGTNAQKGWEPIGTDTNPFKARFNGDGHAISNIYINRTADNSGLFGVTAAGSSIKNLGLLGGQLKSSVGSMGGLVGENNSNISNSYNTASIFSSISSGGIVGRHMSGQISNTYNSGSISGGNDSGGIAGITYSPILNSYNIGLVINSTSSNSSGGIAGYTGVGLNVENSVSFANSVIGGSSQGRIAGSIVGGTISNNYGFADTLQTNNDCGWIGTKFSGNDAHNQANGVTITQTDLATTIFDANWWTNNSSPGNGPGWSTSDWDFENNKLPLLKTDDGKIIAGQNVEPPAYLMADAQDGTSDATAFEISTPEQLTCVANLINAATGSYPSAFYKLTADIDLGGRGSIYQPVRTAGTDEGWIPIGNSYTGRFLGSFDGNGHTISNLYMKYTSTSQNYGGLFGTSGASSQIKNLGMIESHIELVYSSSAYALAGGIIANLAGSISNSYNTGDIKVSIIGSGSYAIAGGIAGDAGSGSISNSYNTGNITANGNGSSALSGGIVGHLGTSLELTYNTGSVTAKSNGANADAHAGGISGFGPTSNSVSMSSNITATSAAGDADAGRITSEISTFPADIANNYAWEETKVNGAKVIPADAGAATIHGKTIKTNQLTDPAFWKAAPYTSDATLSGPVFQDANWQFMTGKMNTAWNVRNGAIQYPLQWLPVLKDFGVSSNGENFGIGSQNDPIDLIHTKFPTGNNTLTPVMLNFTPASTAQTILAKLTSDDWSYNNVEWTITDLQAGGQNAASKVNITKCVVNCGDNKWIITIAPNFNESFSVFGLETYNGINSNTVKISAPAPTPSPSPSVTPNPMPNPSITPMPIPTVSPMKVILLAIPEKNELEVAWNGVKTDKITLINALDTLANLKSITASAPVQTSSGWKVTFANVPTGTYQAEVISGGNTYQSLLTRYDLKFEAAKKFTDLGKLTAERRADVNWLSTAQVTFGMGCDENGGGSECKYAPNNAVNRGAMAQFLRKLASSPESTLKVPKIVDIAKLPAATGSRKDDIKWLAAEGITVVDKNSKFKYNPGNPVNRGAMAQFMWKLAGSPAYSEKDLDKVAKKDNLKKDKALTKIKKSNKDRYYNILWLAKMNITFIDPAVGKYNPSNAVNRGAMAQFMRKLYWVIMTGEKVPDSGIVPSDLPVL